MIFKAGKYPQGDFSKERVRRLVEAYDPERGAEAPVVIGHRYYADTDEGQFAHGWVKALRMDGAGKVYAEVPEFSAEAKRAIAEKKLRYMSVEILEFDKTDPEQPPYLKAIALLGRDTPAFAGAKLPSVFALMTGGGLTVNEEEGIAAFTRRLDKTDASLFSGGEQEGVSMGKIEELEAELAASKAQVAAFEAEREELRVAGRKADAEAFFGKLRDEGKLQPALYERAVALDARLNDGGRAELRALFGELSAKVDLSGKHVADKGRAAALPAGVDLAGKIRAFQAEKSIATFEAAAGALYAERPELFGEGGGV
jgi:hypothetical protein